jgi:hypothetical protein
MDVAFDIVTPGPKREACLRVRDPGVHPFRWMAGSSPAMTMMGERTYAALANADFISANAQSIHCVSSATSLASTVAPHQIRRPAGASR